MLLELAISAFACVAVMIVSFICSEISNGHHRTGLTKFWLGCMLLAAVGQLVLGITCIVYTFR